jgi:hypothetical protein
MKRKLLSLAFLVFACIGATQAQIQKGNVLVGGDLAGLSLGLNSSSPFSFNLTPKAAWFIRDNVALGAYVNFGLETYKGKGGTDTRYGVGALGRYYVSDPSLNVLKHSRFFLEGNVGIEGANYVVSGSTNGLGLGFGPGIAYFITPNIGLETLLKYNGIVGFGSNTTTSTLNLGVGFQIYLPSSKIKSTIQRER